MTATAVTLTGSEILHVCHAALLHRAAAIKHGHGPRYGFEINGREPWSNEIHSLGAEYVVARYFGTFWRGGIVAADMAIAGDVVGYQVRSTQYDHGGLLLHREDPDDCRFVLVTGQMPSYVIRGQLIARDGKLDRYWNARLPTPAFLVPQSDLDPVDPV